MRSAVYDDVMLLSFGVDANISIGVDANWLATTSLIMILKGQIFALLDNRQTSAKCHMPQNVTAVQCEFVEIFTCVTYGFSCRCKVQT